MYLVTILRAYLNEFFDAGSDHLEINCAAKKLCSDGNWLLFKHRLDFIFLGLYFIFFQIAILIHTSYYVTTKAQLNVEIEHQDL